MGVHQFPAFFEKDFFEGGRLVLTSGRLLRGFGGWRGLNGFCKADISYLHCVIVSLLFENALTSSFGWHEKDPSEYHSKIDHQLNQ